jgi:2-hydroxychromene-2-carboxylate isomerase
MKEDLEFVFSFRSPYAWIAARHVLPMVHSETRIRWTPFYPLPSFPNFGGVVPAKARHNLHDILRLTEAYGLPIGRPPVHETDWALAHTAFLWADRNGKGPEFARALLDERWVESQVVSCEGAVRRVADAVGLDGNDAVAAASDPALRGELVARVQANYDEREVFGVPMFILPTGEHFWGHDRMEWADSPWLHPIRRLTPLCSPRGPLLPSRR